MDGVLLTERRSCPINDTVRRISCGATELVPHCSVKNLQRAFSEIKQAGYWSVGSVCEEEQQEKGERVTSIFQLDCPEKLALVVGSEGEGMRRLTEKECDYLVSIPMRGMLQSLNVSQAASVMVFEIMRKFSL